MRSREEAMRIAHTVGFGALVLLSLFALSLWAFGSASLTGAIVGVVAVIVFGVPGVIVGARLGALIYASKLSNGD
jgi:hypothetical protein